MFLKVLLLKDSSIELDSIKKEVSETCQKS